MLNFVQRLTGFFNRTDGERHYYSPEESSYRLGVEAAGVYERLQLGMPLEILRISQELAQAKLDELLEEGKFSFEHFAQGFETMTGATYTDAPDFMALEKKAPGLFAPAGPDRTLERAPL